MDLLRVGASSLRPKQVVIIGSYRGFVPLVLGKALADNLNGGQVIFIDPSFVDDFWKDAQSVRAHFALFDVMNIEHYLMTTQQFTQSEAYRSLNRLGMVFVDGYHSEEQARFDYEAFEGILDPDRNHSAPRHGAQQGLPRVRSRSRLRAAC